MGSFSLKTFQGWSEKRGARGLERGREEKAVEGLCTCTAQATRGLSSCKEKPVLGWRESGLEMYVTGVLSLESLKRGVGWGDFFL